MIIIINNINSIITISIIMIIVVQVFKCAARRTGSLGDGYKFHLCRTGRPYLNLLIDTAKHNLNYSSFHTGLSI